MSKGLHDDAKKLLGMMGKKKPGKKVDKSAWDSRDHQLGEYNDKARKAANQPKASSKKAVKKAEPTKVTTNPAKKKAPVAAQPKTASEKVRKASMQKPVAKAAPKAKAEGVKIKGYSEKAPAIPKGMKSPADKPPPPNAAMKMGAQLEKDLPKGGKAMKVAGELVPGASEKSTMRMSKLAQFAKPTMGKGFAAAALGGAAGLGLQALMESLQAEEAGDPHEGHISDRELQAGAMGADKAINRQAAQAMESGRLKPPMRHEEYGDQERMEDDYAKELKKWPR